ncbi:MAG: 16S rRNA processing protein RimM [Spirochaetaceae bacterium]|nr:16S rRNA processing protein RimM [Spirochaetaceae bacterium]
MEQLVIGIIRGSHGFSGNFKVESTSGEYEHFAKLTDVTVRKNGTEKLYKIESISGGVPFLIMKLAGIESDTQVKMLSGGEILVPRNMACPLKKDEYYVEDLKGCSLVYSGEKGLAGKTAPTTVGTITDVLEGGAGDLLEVSLSESVNELLESSNKDEVSKAPRVVLVPFRKEFIGTVNIKSKTVQLMHLWILE